MSFTRQQEKAAYKKLPEDVRDIIMSSETSELTEGLLKDAGLTDTQEISADGEILYALIGLQSLTTSIENIAKLSGKQVSGLSQLRSKLETNIFDKIKGLGINLEEFVALNKTETVTNAAMPKPEPVPDLVIEKGDVGPIEKLPERPTSNLPETLPGEGAHVVPHVEERAEPKRETLVQTPAYTAAPLPTGPNKTPDEGPKRPELNLPKSDYTSGQDPYREPLA